MKRQPEEVGEMNRKFKPSFIGNMWELRDQVNEPLMSNFNHDKPLKWVTKDEALRYLEWMDRAFGKA